MKYIAIAALLLTISATGGFAQQTRVKMKFSGTAANSAVTLQQPDSSMDEDNFAGSGALGPFTVRNIRSLPNSPTPSSSCSGYDQIHFTETLGGSVFRFGDGSLLVLKLTGGSDCINTVTGEADCVLMFQITGGTGRFKNASGTLTMTEKALPAVLDAGNNAAVYIATGNFTGTISGVAVEQQGNAGQ